MKNQFIFIAIFIGTLYSQCDSYTSSECDSNSDCEWVENIESVTCASLTWDEELCEASPDCNYSCWDADGYFGWCEPSCSGGMTYIDNGYCTEVEVLECSELSHGPCLNDEGCEWVENVDYYSCSNFSQGQCNQYNSCSWTLSYGGGYGSWNYSCSGSYEVNNSFCQEVEYISGDINGDFLINILDIIQIVNLILVTEYNFIVDMNYDGNVNVLDVVLVVDIILGN